MQDVEIFVNIILFKTLTLMFRKMKSFIIWSKLWNLRPNVHILTPMTLLYQLVYVLYLHYSWLFLKYINQISIFNLKGECYAFSHSWFAWNLCIKKQTWRKYKNECYITENFYSLYLTLLFLIFQMCPMNKYCFTNSIKSMALKKKYHACCLEYYRYSITGGICLWWVRLSVNMSNNMKIKATHIPFLIYLLACLPQTDFYLEYFIFAHHPAIFKLETVRQCVA